MERDGGHADGVQSREVEAGVEEVEPSRGFQVLGGRTKGVADGGVRRGGQAGDGGAGVQNGAAVALVVQMEGRGRDGGKLGAANTDPRDLNQKNCISSESFNLQQWLILMFLQDLCRDRPNRYGVLNIKRRSRHSSKLLL